MTIVQTIALMVGLGALMSAVIRVRKRGTFPLATLVKKWFPYAPSLAHLVIGVSAGIASVIVVPAIVVLRGWGQISLAEPITSKWIGLAVASVAIKILFVIFEEMIFRGAVIFQIRHRAELAATVGISALIFAAAHHGRSLIDSAILFTDGIGFALAFVITRSLWVPVIWHASKNLSVWLFLGSGTIELTHGLFEFQQPGLGLGFGSPDSAGLLDLGITISVVGVATLSLTHSRVRNIKAG